MEISFNLGFQHTGSEPDKVLSLQGKEGDIEAHNRLDELPPPYQGCSVLRYAIIATDKDFPYVRGLYSQISRIHNTNIHKSYHTLSHRSSRRKC